MCLELWLQPVSQGPRGLQPAWGLLVTPPQQQQQHWKHWNAKWQWRVQSTSSITTSTTTFFLQNKSIFWSYVTPKYTGWKRKPLSTLHGLPSACIGGSQESPLHPQYCPSLNTWHCFSHVAPPYTQTGRLWLGQRIIHSANPTGFNSIGNITFACVAGLESLQLS